MSVLGFVRVRAHYQIDGSGQSRTIPEGTYELLDLVLSCKTVGFMCNAWCDNGTPLLVLKEEVISYWSEPLGATEGLSLTEWRDRYERQSA